MSLNSMRNSFHHSAKWIFGVVGVAMLVTAFTGIGSNLGMRRGAQAVAPQTSDDVLATVNGVPLTRAEYNNAYNIAKQMQMLQQEQFSVMSDGETRGKALTTGINQVETLITARNAGVTATSADIERARNAQLPGIRSQLSLPANASVNDINTAWSKLPNPQTVDEALPDAALRDQVLVTKWQAQLQASSQPSDADLTMYYKSVHTRHILIDNKTRPDAQALSRAQQIIAKLKAGGDFAALAKQYSDDPGTKEKGGDDGVITEQTPYVAEFLNAALTLKQGQVTPQPVKSPQYGYFIIQALDVKDTHPKDFQKNTANYRQQVAQFLANRSEEAAVSAVAATAKVDIKEPLLRALWTLQQRSGPGQTPDGQRASAIADLNKAVMNTSDYQATALAYAILGSLAKGQKNYKDAITDLNNAVTSTEDPQLRIMLGQAYQETGNTTAALTQYSTASDNSYGDPSVHLQLQQIYSKLKQPALAKKEGDLFRQGEQQQAQSPMGGLSLPPGVQPAGAEPHFALKAAAKVGSPKK